MAISKDVKVGAFVLAGLVAIGIVIFLIGDERRLFTSKQPFTAVFNDVDGLNRGAPVRMGGVDVGVVEAVTYSDDPKDRAIYVKLMVVAEESLRIREDSVATVQAKGLLGDKMVVISAGNPEKPVVPPQGRIATRDGDDISKLMGNLSRIGQDAEHVLKNLDKTTGALADSAFHDDLKSSVSSLASILKALNQGDGYLSHALHDPEQAERVGNVLENLERASGNLVKTSDNMNQTLERVNHGPGLVHELLYGESSSATAAQIGSAADEIAATLRGIREGKGLAHALVYGDERSDQLLANVSELSRELHGAVVDMRAGKGTLGALLVDPSVYEDIKVLLGNVQRNKALRALVRYSIKQDEATPAPPPSP